MKALLMHANRDFDLDRQLQQDLSSHERTLSDDLTQDLGLDTLFRSMAGDDPFLFAVARMALLAGIKNDTDTILYRQEVVKDCFENPAIVRELYNLAVEAIESRRKNFWGYISRYPSGTLYGSVDMLETLTGILEKLKGIRDRHVGQFTSRAFTALFAMLQTEFSDEYFTTVRNHLKDLRFKDGILLSAGLGKDNEGTDYMLHQTQATRSNWFERLFQKQLPAFTFRIAERDEAGSRALADIRNRGINQAANVVAQSTEHIVGFFEMLKTELAFYVGCLNLHDRLVSMGASVCLPRPEPMGARKLQFGGLYDVSLVLHMARRIVSNSSDADGKSLVIITGANQGGKSSFMRSVGLAQLMMQCGMFVCADVFAAELCAGVFTHYKREEDSTMNKGKLDEELSRLSGIVDAITPNAMMLFNESFAATNEREGSEIAREVTDALLEKRVKILFVTHQYEFAHGFFARKMEDALFLRAERQPDGTRTFRISLGEPLETSYGVDVYESIFGSAISPSNPS